MRFGRFLLKRKLNFFLFLFFTRIKITLFKKPSRISFTCSGRNDPTIKIKGIADSGTDPPQSGYFELKGM
jgi:hypothetical protein